MRRLAILGLAAGCAGAAADPAPAPAAVRCPHGMIGVPAGQFVMGDPWEGRDAGAHAVTLSAFCLDRTEVTEAAYARCVAAGRCTPAFASVYWPKMSSEQQRFWSPFCHAGRRGLDNHPVNCIEWEQARAYCDFAGKRLPTEAEWEYAARGGDGRHYPWGNASPTARRENACGTECTTKVGTPWLVTKLGKDAWVPTYAEDDGFVTTAPVGSFPAGASRFGALDLAGNVWEWVGDWYQPYPSAAAVDPQSPLTGDQRVYRGGGWSGDGGVGTTRAMRRGHADPRFRSSSGGVRCAAPALP